MVKMKKTAKDDVEQTILNEEYHARLIQDIETVAATARVHIPMLHRAMATYCPEEQVDWVKAYPVYMHDNSGGLCITGKPKDVHNQMAAIACAFLRNYVDARVIPIHELLKPDVDPENPSVLLIPDFYVNSVSGNAAFTNWQLRELYGLLLNRYVQRRATILYVQNMTGLRKEYGEATHDLIESQWQIV